jgi:hypothetical protein
MKLCECGCGEKPPLATKTNTKAGRIKGVSTRFIRGHNPTKSTEERFCQICRNKITRHIFESGRIEDRKIYLKRKFCSQECSVIAKTGEGAHNWNGGRKIDKSGYIYLLVGKDHHLAGPSGYALEHRVIAEKAIGRRLRDYVLDTGSRCGMMAHPNNGGALCQQNYLLNLLEMNGVK